jgi:hypothetical protein
MDMRFDTWNVRSLYMAGSLATAAREKAKYLKLDLVGVWEVRWHRGSSEPTGNYTFFYGNGNENHKLGTCSLYISESYQQLWSCRCDIVLNIHVPVEDKQSFHEELKYILNQFPVYHVKILLDFNAKVGREHNFKPVILFYCILFYFFGGGD